MSIRELNEKDIAFLRNAEFLPKPENTIVAGASDSNGYGFLELFAEALLILNPAITNREKISTIKDLIDKMVEVSKKRNIPEIYVFVSDDGFKNILQKHFGFEKCGGTPLVLHIRE